MRSSPFTSFSFLTGAASIFAVSGSLSAKNIPSSSSSDWEKDAHALQSDWSVVGQDLESTLSKIREKALELDHVR